MQIISLRIQTALCTMCFCSALLYHSIKDIVCWLSVYSFQHFSVFSIVLLC